MIRFPWTHKPPYGVKLNRQHPLAQYLTGAWLMNEQGGNKVFDVYRNFNGTITGADWVPTGIDFNTSLDKVNCGNAGKILNSEGSIVFEYQKIIDPAAFYYWAVIDDDYNEFSIIGNIGSVIQFYINGSIAALGDTSGISDGKKHTLIFTWSAASNRRTLSIDGKLHAEDTTAFTWDAAGIDDHDFLIGGRLTGADRHAGGIVSYFDVFNKELNHSELVSLHANPYQIFEPLFIPSAVISSGGSTIQGACADGFSLSESIGKAAIFSALAQESINLADSDQNIGSFLSAIADSLAMSDQATRTVNFPVGVSDNFTLADSVVAADLAAINALVNDTINLSDTTVSRVDFMATIQETVTLSDASINLLSAIAQVTEALNISDAVFWAGIQSAFVTDSLTISDQVTRIFQTFASVAENFNVSDAPGVTATFDVTATDIVQFAEAISNIAAFRASVVDSFNVQATPMEVSTLPNGKVSVSFSIKVPGVGMEMKTATIVFNIT